MEHHETSWESENAGTPSDSAVAHLSSVFFSVPTVVHRVVVL